MFATNYGETDPEQVMEALFDATHFGPGGRNREDEYPIFGILRDEINSSDLLNDNRSLNLANSHMGTQGDGNHFAFVGKSELTGDTWLITHHGSRGFGARLYKKGMAIAQKFAKEICPNLHKSCAWIPMDTREGEEYWRALQIVRKWTRENHKTIHTNTKHNLPGGVGMRCDYFWNEHNFVFQRGDSFFHAKGATPMRDFSRDSWNQKIIPLNMAEPVLFVCPTQSENGLGFAPHGAGRNVSRTAHKKSLLDGKSYQEIFEEETEGLDVRFWSGLPDVSELPSAYKSAEAVQRQMEKFDLAKVVDRIMPYGCIMAGDWIKYKPSK